MATALATPVFPEPAIAMVAALPIGTAATALIPSIRTALAAGSATLGRGGLLGGLRLMSGRGRLFCVRLGTSPVLGGGGPALAPEPAATRRPAHPATLVRKRPAGAPARGPALARQRQRPRARKPPGKPRLWRHDVPAPWRVFPSFPPFPPFRPWPDGHGCGSGAISFSIRRNRRGRRTVWNRQRREEA